MHTEPSPAAEQALRNRIRELTRRSTTWKEHAAAVREINRVTRGWGNYFALAHYHQELQANELLRCPSAPSMAMA